MTKKNIYLNIKIDKFLIENKNFINTICNILSNIWVLGKISKKRISIIRDRYDKITKRQKEEFKEL